MSGYNFLCKASITGVNAILIAGLGMTSVEAALINFDTDANGQPINAPDFFIGTTSLTELYAPLGVNFSGPGGNNGGAILNEGGNFGVDARSGLNFLAFNRDVTLSDGGVPTDPETISFDTPLTSFSIFVSNGYTGGDTGYSGEPSTFTLNAFDISGELIGNSTVTGLLRNYRQLSFSSSVGNISKVVLTSTGSEDNAFVYDDLSFTSVPEPSSILGTLAFGVLGTAYLLRRKLRKG